MRDRIRTYRPGFSKGWAWAALVGVNGSIARRSIAKRGLNVSRELFVYDHEGVPSAT